MAADKKDLPEGLAGEIARNWEQARQHWNGWRTEARECYAFYAGDQWQEDDLALLREQGRPCVTFNRITPLVDAVLGHEANNRTEVRYIPRTMGDSKVSEMLTAASNYFRDGCDAEHEESDAFRDCMIGGIGCTQVLLSDDDNPEYDLKLERIDPFEVLVDPRSRKPNFADKRWVIREKRMSRDEIASIWPDVAPVSDPIWAQSWEAEKTASPRDGYRTQLAGEQEDKGHLVLEYQYIDIEVYYIVKRPDTGATMVLDADTYEAQSDNIKETGAEVEMKRRHTWKRAFMVGNEIVQEDAPSPKACTYAFMTGKRDRAAGTWFGVIRSLLDPQRMTNKWLSQMTNIINSNSQGGVMVERSAIAGAGVEDFEAKWADPRGIIYVEDGALAKGAIREKPIAPFPQGVHQLYALAEQAFMQVSGINQELLGLADREQAGVLEWQRKQSAVSMLAPLFDSLRRYRKISGRVWLFFMRTYISDGRMIRIVSDKPQQIKAPMPVQPPAPPQMPGQPPAPPGPPQVQNVPVNLQQGDNYVPFWRDEAVSEYDIIVDQSSAAPNIKEQTWAVLQQLLPSLKGMVDGETMLMFLPYTPLPESLVSEMKAAAAKKAEKGPPPDPKMMEAQASIQAEQAKMQAEMQMKQQQMQLDQQMAQQRQASSIAMKQQELAAKMELQRQEAEATLLLERNKAMMEHQAEMAKVEAQTQTALRTAEIQSGTQGNIAMMRSQADSTRDQKLAEAEMQRDERIRAAEEERTTALAQFMQQLTEKQAQQSEQLSQFLASVSEGQKQMAQAVQAMSEAQSMDTELVKMPDGSKRTRKVKRS